MRTRVKALTAVNLSVVLLAVSLVPSRPSCSPLPNVCHTLSSSVQQHGHRNWIVVTSGSAPALSEDFGGRDR